MSAFIMTACLYCKTFQHLKSSLSVKQISTLKPYVYKSKNNGKLEFLIRQAGPNEHDRILNFMLRYFINNEPTFLNMGMFKSEPPDPAFSKILMNSIKQDKTVLAEVVGERTLVAAHLNTNVNLQDAIDFDEKVSRTLSPGRTKDVVDFWCYLKKESLPRHRVNHDKCFWLTELAVNTHFRGFGLGKLLIHKAVELGKELGFESYKAETTSRRTEAVMRKIPGCRSIFSVEYRNHTVDGRHIFQNVAEPHIRATIFEGYYKDIV